MPEDKRFVVVTDTHRTVWCGWTDEDGRGDHIRLTKGRHVYYFDTDEGIGELAQSGPGHESKIGAEIPEMVVNDVSTVMDCTEAAAERFASQGWGGTRDE